MNWMMGGPGNQIIFLFFLEISDFSDVYEYFLRKSFEYLKTFFENV